MVFPLTVASDCCAGPARPRRPHRGGEACHGHEPIVIYTVGVLHARGLWAFLHDRTPARIGQHLTDASISAPWPLVELRGLGQGDSLAIGRLR